MIYYSGFNTGRIVSCFNSTLTLPANTTPPCGFTATKFGTGDYSIDLGWKVDNRFFPSVAAMRPSRCARTRMEPLAVHRLGSGNEAIAALPIGL
jgi:hypothetical protein